MDLCKCKWVLFCQISKDLLLGKSNLSAEMFYKNVEDIDIVCKHKLIIQLHLNIRFFIVLYYIQLEWLTEKRTVRVLDEASLRFLSKCSVNQKQSLLGYPSKFF